MEKEKKMFVTAPEIAEMLGISVGHAYNLIRKMNKDLKESGYLVVAGRVPVGYFQKCWYGFNV